MTPAEFEREVIQQSAVKPVLVDFWAPWCGPCRVLGPILDRIHAESRGRWSLLKLNTDESPEVSASLGIRGIPAVHLFIDGKVTREFTGALPEAAVRRWLEEALPSDPGLAAIDRCIDAGQQEAAAVLLENRLLEEPESQQARIRLAKLRAFTQPGEAARLIKGLSSSRDQLSILEAIKVMQKLSAERQDPDGLPEGIGKEAYRRALTHLVEQEYVASINCLIDVLQQNRYYHDDAARKAGVAIFTLLGPRHDAATLRRSFDMWLY